MMFKGRTFQHFRFERLDLYKIQVDNLRVYPPLPIDIFNVTKITGKCSDVYLLYLIKRL